mgnify:CR=1 FL=1
MTGLGVAHCQCGGTYPTGRVAEHRASRDHIERTFWPRVQWSPDCWTWTRGHDPSGYATFHWPQAGGYAHRAAYLLAVGPIPDGYVIDHLCRNRGCVNPAHLEPVTPQMNTLRSPIHVAALATRTA